MLELLAKRAQSSEPGFSDKYVRWAIVFDSKAGFGGVVELGQPEQNGNRGRRFEKCPEMDRGLLQAGGKSHFLVESANVVALYKVEDADEKITQKHKFFIDMLEEAGRGIPQLTTIARFMKDEDVLQRIRGEMECKKVKPSDKVTFRLDGEFSAEQDYWHGWWRNFHRKLISAGRKPGELGKFRCFVTGELVTPTRTHPKIMGLAAVDGRVSGDVLVGYDKEAFCSYGLKQSFNCAVSVEAAKAYVDGLNELIRSYGQRLAGAMVVHWFKEKLKDEDDPLPWLTGPSEIEELDAQERAKKLLHSLESGERPDLAGNRYYILTMSGAAGRVMVRDWLEGDFAELVRNINGWFDDMQMVWYDGIKIARPPGFISVLQALTRDLNSLPPQLVSKLWRVAIRGEGIPYQIHTQSVTRRRFEIVQDERLDIAGMGLIRAYHLRKYRKEGNKLAEALRPELNKDFPNVAYQAGRLMAALADLQRRALGDVGAGVVQRYYVAASTTPALVLGRLTGNSQHHLNKLDAGLACWYEGKISEIWSNIREPLPRTLTLEEQSLFALGYYHQLASFRAGKSENSKETKEK